MNPNTLHYTVKESDWLAFHRYHVATSPAAIRQARKVRWTSTGSLVAVFCLMLFVERGHPERVLSLAVVAGITTVLYFFFIPGHLRQKSEKQAMTLIKEGTNASVLGDFSLSYDANELQVQGSASSGIYRWSGIERAAITSTHIFVYVSALSAIVIPILGIQQGNIQEFEAYISSHGVNINNGAEQGAPADRPPGGR